VRNPANDAPTEIVSCADASAHSDWVFTHPGDNLSVQLAGTNLCAHPPSGMSSSADVVRTQLLGRRLRAAEQRAGEGVHLLPGPRGAALVLHGRRAHRAHGRDAVPRPRGRERRAADVRVRVREHEPGLDSWRGDDTDDGHGHGHDDSDACADGQDGAAHPPKQRP
jgi:hypothetical protein